MKTKFKKFKSFSSKRKAEEFIKDNKDRLPEDVFVAEKSWPNKIKTRFHVRSVWKKGFKR